MFDHGLDAVGRARGCKGCLHGVVAETVGDEQVTYAAQLGIALHQGQGAAKVAAAGAGEPQAALENGAAQR